MPHVAVRWHIRSRPVRHSRTAMLVSDLEEVRT